MWHVISNVPGAFVSKKIIKKKSWAQYCQWKQLLLPKILNKNTSVKDPRTLQSNNVICIVESRDHLGWKRPWRSSSPTMNITPPSLPLNHVPEHHIYKSFKYLQGWRLSRFPGQPVPMLDNPFSEDIYPSISSKPPLAQSDRKNCSKLAHKVIRNPLFSNRVVPQSIAMTKVTLSHLGGHTKSISGCTVTVVTSLQLKAHLSNVKASAKVTSPKGPLLLLHPISPDSKPSTDTSAALFCYKTDRCC